MEIKVLPVGYLQANCYILEKESKCLIIDPGDESEKIIKEIGQSLPVGIIVTHYHDDHIGALDEIKRKYNLNVYDIHNMNEGINKIEDFIFEIIYTKGHDDTCITIYFKEERLMFTGDFLFKDTIGRIDLKNSNYDDMIDSINKIKKYSDDILVYPGHGDFTKLGDEKKYNFYFNNKF